MSNQMKTILVVGATGSIGSLVVEEAHRQGHSFRALMRSADKARRLPAKAEAVIGDLTRPAPQFSKRRSGTLTPLSSPMDRMVVGRLARRQSITAESGTFSQHSVRGKPALR